MAGLRQLGATAGARLEYGFAPNGSVAVEYAHLFISRRNLDFYDAASGALRDTAQIGGDVDFVTARLNYRFGGPAVARD